MIGSVGLVGVLISPAYLGTVTSTLVTPKRQVSAYYALFYLFWAALLAVPLAGNLGTAWLLVEATTAASALLVGFAGTARALEAGWKYLILTSLGLGIALLGIVVLAAGVPGGGLASLTWRALPGYGGGASNALVAYLLLLVGLAAKIGWAPVHNWLPDAHSQAPAPVSAMLSAALLPAVLLIAWRCEQGLAPVIGLRTAQNVLIGFGLTSVAVAVPFLSRRLAWKRLLAYSSLEHMGVIALGIGFGIPAGPGRGRVAPHRPCHRQDARLRGRDAVARPPAGGRVGGRERDRPQPAGPRRRYGGLPRHPVRAPPVAPLRQRVADRGRGLPGRPGVGGRGDGVAAGPGLPGAQPVPAGDDRVDVVRHASPGPPSGSPACVVPAS